MNTYLMQETKQLLLKKFNSIPQIAIITGSGIKIFRKYNPSCAIKYNDLPIWSNHETKTRKKVDKQKIKGHEGVIKLYKIKNKTILVFSGRRHLYEGLKVTDVVANIRLAYEVGVKKVIMTNAAGGISKNLKVGDLMLITGFINLMQPTERGNLNSITQPLKKIKSNLLKLITQELRGKLKTGIYAGGLGPSYETYAEIKLLQALGADAVGMSTIPEIICASSLGLDYAAVSVISNSWNKKHIPSHNEVIKHVNRANKKLDAYITKIVKELS